MILKGRTKILSNFNNEELKDFNNVAKLINLSMTKHRINKSEIDYLVNYRRGTQTILYKEKPVRSEINNKLVLNHAEMVTRTIVGYFLGTPIQYIQAGADKKDEIDKLNQYVSYEDKAYVDKQLGEYQSICGTAYRIIYTDKEVDEVPFGDKTLNPATTFVVYENSIVEKPLIGVTYYEIINEDGEVENVKYYAYTTFGLYQILTEANGIIDDKSSWSLEAYGIGHVPIIEYPNNMWRIGDWELCITLMDAINALYSGRMDDVDQIIQSLLVFINAEIDGEMYDEMREKGVVMLNNKTGQPSSVETITSDLDQQGMNLLAEELETLFYAIIGIPDRKNRNGGGGDTGQAVELRDGWADLEILTRTKELTFKKSEKLTLRVILNILRDTEKFDLMLKDVDIKFSRNKTNNLLVKTQGYMNLLSTKTLSPEDCLTIVDLVSDVNEYISRGKAFWKDEFAKKGMLKVEESEDKQDETNPETKEIEENGN